MDSRRAASALVFSAFFAVLASAPITAAAQPAPSAGAISDAQFQKIVAMIHLRKKPSDLLPSIANALGLADDGKEAVLGHLIITDRQGSRYQISVLNNGKGYLLMRHSGASARMFLMDANRALVTALTVESDQYPSIIPADDAQKLFAQDLAAWARVSDAYPAPKTP